MMSIWFVVAIVAAIAGMRFMANSASKHSRTLHRVLGLVLWMVSVLCIHVVYPWPQAIFTGLGLLSLIGFSWVFLNPKQRRSE